MGEQVSGLQYTRPGYHMAGNVFEALAGFVPYFPYFFLLI
jgi:hypothetical protein